MDGGTEFHLDVYGNKPRFLENEFMGFSQKRTVYFGDNRDEEPAFEYVAGNGGRIVIPFYASPEFKEHASGKASYRDKVFVPENEQELSRFLQSLKS